MQTIDRAYGTTLDEALRPKSAGRPTSADEAKDPGLPGSARTAAAPREKAHNEEGEGILLVEDQEGLRDLVATILRRQGYRLFEAGSVPAALAIWRDHHHDIDLLLTDLVMPDTIDGRELAEKLAAEQPALRVMITSGLEYEKTG